MKNILKSNENNKKQKKNYFIFQQNVILKKMKILQCKEQNFI